MLVAVLVVLVWTMTPGFVGATEAAPGEVPDAVAGAPVGQAGDNEAPQSQSATGDGTLPFRILAIAMGSLAALLGVLTFWYWKATVPPARRGYLPQTRPINDSGDAVESGHRQPSVEPQPVVAALGGDVSAMEIDTRGPGREPAFGSVAHIDPTVRRSRIERDPARASSETDLPIDRTG